MRENWCEKCRWWGAERAHSHHHPYGKCRKALPVMGKSLVLPYHDPDQPEAAGPLVRVGEWPWVAFDDWCAHWEAKK